MRRFLLSTALAGPGAPTSCGPDRHSELPVPVRDPAGKDVMHGSHARDDAIRSGVGDDRLDVPLEFPDCVDAGPWGRDRIVGNDHPDDLGAFALGTTPAVP